MARKEKGMLVSSRHHWFEINDQKWWPQFLREKVQDVLTLLWSSTQPLVVPNAPAALAAQVLTSTLGPNISDYVYVDFASGAGGPTPYIERTVNSSLSSQGKTPVNFVLSDIAPHLSAWTALSHQSPNLSYIPTPVDAANAPPTADLLANVPAAEGKKVLRLFNLAFHHFDDPLASSILRNTIETSDGFAIFELQSRHPSSFVTISLMWPLLMISSWWHFRRSLSHLFFTYVLPAVPVVVVFDGYVSSIRTRTVEEVEGLLRGAVGEERLEREGWRVQSGWVRHSWPTGWMSWIICTKGD